MTACSPRSRGVAEDPRTVEDVGELEASIVGARAAVTAPAGPRSLPPAGAGDPSVGEGSERRPRPRLRRGRRPLGRYRVRNSYLDALILMDGASLLAKRDPDEAHDALVRVPAVCGVGTAASRLEVPSHRVAAEGAALDFRHRGRDRCDRGVRRPLTVGLREGGGGVARAAGATAARS